MIYLIELHFSWTLFWNFVNLNMQIKQKSFAHFKMLGKLKNFDSHCTKSNMIQAFFKLLKHLAYILNMLSFSLQIDINKNLPDSTISLSIQNFLVFLFTCCRKFGMLEKDLALIHKSYRVKTWQKEVLVVSWFWLNYDYN